MCLKETRENDTKLNFLGGTAMSEKNRLTDEQLEEVIGGEHLSITLNGETVVLGGPETFLRFSELERAGGLRSGLIYDGYRYLPEVAEYFDWYYSYYNEIPIIFQPES